MIPVSEPRLGEAENRYVQECLATGWISSAGRFIDEFEQRWADYCGMPYGVAMANGSVALSAALACLDLPPGAEVILPTFTIISCAWAILDNGAVPVLVDSDPQTWGMAVEQVEARLTSRTRAILPVHIYGHPVDMDPLRALAERHHLLLVEDAAEAHGAEYKGQRCGGLGDLSCFSFYANKIITTGEGGMVLARTAAQAERLRAERNLAFRPDRRFYHTAPGHNYRLTNLQAAIGLGQVERIADSLARKRWLGRAYTERLRDWPELQLPVEAPWATNVYWMYGVVLTDVVPFEATELARRLKHLGVETRPFFLGMHEQPVLQARGLFQDESFPVAERLARRGLYLPSGLNLTEAQVETVVQALRTALSQ